MPIETTQRSRSRSTAQVAQTGTPRPFAVTFSGAWDHRCESPRRETVANRKRKDVFTTGQVAAICNVAPRTVSKWFDSGQLRGYRIPGSKDRRIPIEYLVRFMKAHGIPLTGLDLGITRVLLVDEDAEFAKATSQALGDEDCEVTVAGSAFECGVLAERVRPHVIVADVSVQDVDPKRIRQALRLYEHLSGVKLIAVGRQLSAGDGQALLQQGLAGYLSKPFEASALRDLIDHVTNSDE